jgi:hypothetical protein
LEKIDVFEKTIEILGLTVVGETWHGKCCKSYEKLYPDHIKPFGGERWNVEILGYSY